MFVGGTGHTDTGNPILGDRAISFDSRAKEIAAEEEREREAQEEAKKNKNFYMVFRNGGSQALRALMKKSPLAAQLFLYLAENIDKSNAIVASGRILADVLKVHETAVSRAIKVLVDENCVVRIKCGGANVFVLNPEIIWNSWATGKNRCWFDNAKVLIGKGEQPESVRKQMAILLKKFDGTLPIETPLFPDEEE